jgi:molybdopterin-binding protein
VKVGPVTAEVTEASVDKLGLTAGRRVVATFKATGTRLVPYG